MKRKCPKEGNYLKIDIKHCQCIHSTKLSTWYSGTLNNLSLHKFAYITKVVTLKWKALLIPSSFFFG